MHDGSANAILSGNYAFELTGFDPKGNPYVVIGDFKVDGKGSITNGNADANATTFATSEQQYSFSGTYSVGDANNDNRGTTTWNNSNTAATGLPASTTYCFAASGITSGVAQGGRIIEADGSGFIMTGIFRAQNTADFTESALSGGYVFDLQGFGGESPINRQAIIGQVSLNGSGGVTGGQFDSAFYKNDTQATQYQSQAAISGTGSSYSVGANGRGTLTLNVPGGSTSQVIYMIGTGNSFFMLSTGAGKTGGLLSGQAYQQTTTSFSEASLKGTAVFRADGTTNPANSGPVQSNVQAGQLSFDGSGSVSITSDQNNGGTITNEQQSGWAYTVTSSGYLQITGNNNKTVNFYLFAPGNGLGLQGNNGVSFFLLAPQTVPAGGFTNSFLVNNAYSFGSVYPNAYSAAGEYPTTEAGAVLFKSGGVLPGVEDLARAADTYAVDQEFQNSYTFDPSNGASTGRFVITNENGTAVLAGYMVGKGEAFFIGIDPSSNPGLYQAEHQ